MNDPIVEEVRRARDAYAARFNYDLDAIYQDIKEQEKKSGRKFVSFRPSKAEPSQASQQVEISNSLSNDGAPLQVAPAVKFPSL